jgi:MEMO1 family protein
MRTNFILIAILILAGAAGFIFGKTYQPISTHRALGFHKSYNVSVQVFEQAFSLVSAKQIPANPEIKGILVNHHLLAAPFIAETMQTIATTEPVTVVLVSPNHFFLGTGNAITSEYDWQTPYGVLPANTGMIKKIHGVTVQEFPFDNEHGITGIVPFIKKTMPNATVVPIILKEGTSPQELADLAQSIEQASSGRTVMVGSVDFSHYLPKELMDFHDVLAEHVLKTFDFENIDRMEINSQATVRLLLTYMQNKEATHFTVLNHSNSAELTQHDDLTSGTSYITGYFLPGNKMLDNHQTFLAVGQIDFHNESLLTEVERMFNGTSQTLVQSLDQNLVKLGVTDLQSKDALTNLRPGPFIISTNIDNVPPHAIISLTEVDQVTAHSLIDRGADLVLGQGLKPGPVAVYRNRLIIYSLGQLDGQSIVIGLDRSDSGLTYTLLATEVRDGQVHFLPAKQSDILKAQNIYHFNY